MFFLSRKALVALSLVSAALLLCLPQGATSQVLYGSLTGNVTDSSGAVAMGRRSRR